MKIEINIKKLFLTESKFKPTYSTDLNIELQKLVKKIQHLSMVVF